jgi:3-oxoacyl-[acyl-carrier-protein] synthase-1
MTVPVDIVATGARTPIGLRSAPVAAAVRAGISGLGTHPFMVDQVGDPMPAAMDALLDPGLTGVDRLLALAETALREACAPLAGRDPKDRLRLPMYLGLPEIRPGFSQDDVNAVRAGLTRFGRLPVAIADVHVLPAGHAAGLAALAAAVERIRLGGCEACLVGGVDSYFHPDTMEWLDANRQLVGAVSRSGFVPGEGAGFCLVAAASARERLGLPARARVLTVGVSRETSLIKTTDLCLGEGLTSAVRAAVDARHLPARRVNAVICDINSERYRGEEWGFVCLRVPEHFDDPTAYVAPADAWGDVGAASGPLFAMLACEAAARGYAAGPTTLAWASSESGLRAAAVLSTEVATRGRAGGLTHE